MMKVYVHWVGDEGSPFTKVLKLSDNSAVADLRVACWDALIARHPTLGGSGPIPLLLSGPDGRSLPMSSLLSDVLSSGDDVFFRLNGQQGHAGEMSSGCVRTTTTTSSIAAESTPSQAAVTNIAATTAPEEAARPSTATSPQQDQHAAAGTAPTAIKTQAHNGTSEGSASCNPSKQHQAQQPHKPQQKQQQQRQPLLPDLPEEQLLPLVRALWVRAEEAAAQQNYRAGAEALQQALLLLPRPSGPLHVASLQRLARMWLAAGNPAAAAPWALRAVQARQEDVGVLQLAGDCLREGGRPREAVLHYQAALELLEERASSGSSGSSSGSSSSGGDSSSAGAGNDATTSSSSIQQLQLRLRVSLAACLYDIPSGGSPVVPPYDNHDLAASLVMGALEADPGCWEALRLYGRIAADRGMRDEALRVALRLVVGRPQQREGKALLAECLQDEEGCALLFEELNVPLTAGEQQQQQACGGGSGGGGGVSGTAAAAGTAAAPAAAAAAAASSAAALGFVANSVKDEGQVDSCIRLLQCAVQLHPRNASYSLNLVHALELRQDLQGALAAGWS
ncbi:hypothetical protein Agub_g8769 [Astrephomene gubernaculifera]|uniref:Uncharacterized protein n=1 Tax=Astrephomene gubernaculifera TaxID=47775 RepID=A0AAD3DUV6_9CHLO|nr:hypothetical protein Agub_g8769 [Astrephomene gubernaculifera]